MRISRGKMVQTGNNKHKRPEVIHMRCWLRLALVGSKLWVCFEGRIENIWWWPDCDGEKRESSNFGLKKLKE